MKIRNVLVAGALALSLAAPCWAKPIHFFYFAYITPTFYPASGATPYYDGPYQISRFYQTSAACNRDNVRMRWIGINGAPPLVFHCFEVNVSGHAIPTPAIPQQ